jgi:hypothetical protein
MIEDADSRVPHQGSSGYIRCGTPCEDAFRKCSRRGHAADFQNGTAGENAYDLRRYDIWITV